MFIFDFEVFKFDWLVVLKNMATGRYITIINDKNKLKELYEENKNDLFIGYNNIAYDNIIFKGILSDVDPAEITRLIFASEKGTRHFVSKALGIKQFHLNTIDLMQDILGMSLKEAEGFMKMSIEESDVSFDIDRPLTEDEIKQVVKYCTHDVDATEQLLHMRLPYVKSKMNLIKMFKLGSSYLEKTNAALCAVILSAKRRKHTDEFEYDLPPEVNITKYTKIFDLYMNRKLDYDEKLKIDIAGVPHILAYGGIHGALNNFIHKGELWQIDAASYYPTLMLEYNYISRNLKDNAKYKEIYDTRIKAKHEKNKAVSDSLKLVLNTAYGAMKSQYNELSDPKMANQVCITGQLLLVDLIEKLEPYCKLVQSNTDGILVIPYNKERIQEVIKEWEKRTRIVLEIDPCSGVWQKDVNNYIMLFEDGSVKTKGAFVSQYNESSFNIRNNTQILDIAVVDYFTKGIHPIDTIMNCNDIHMFQIITNTGSVYDRTVWSVNNVDVEVNKVNRVYATTDTSKGKLYKIKTEKGKRDSIANLPDNCQLANDNKFDINLLDKNYYIQRALSRIAYFEGTE